MGSWERRELKARILHPWREDGLGAKLKDNSEETGV